jgi:hypothetical protein
VQFTLRTLMVFFVFVASALGAMGGWGLLVVAWLAAMVVLYRRNELGAAVLILLASAFFALIIWPVPARGPSPRSVCFNNMKQLVLALLNYHSKHGCFPPAYIADENGKPMHSWRVLILPYLERSDLHEEYDFSQPWDSPSNLALAKRFFPRVFRCPNDTSASENTTSYVAVVGPETAWPAPNSSQESDFKDGLSQTVLLVEVANSGILWTEPRDLTLDEALAGVNVARDRGIRSGHDSAAVVAMADGSVLSIPAGLDPDVLRAMLTRSGGKEIDLHDLWAHAPGPPPPEPFRRTQAFRTLGALVVFVISGVVLLRMTRPPPPAPALQGDSCRREDL